MNALTLLLDEHNSHRNLMELIEKDKTYFSQFRTELIHHVNMEEAILYPNLLKVPQLEMIVREAWEEHSLCMQLLQEMDDPSLTEKMWASKFAILKKLLLTHLEEEEIRLFPKINDLASGEFLSEVGQQMLIQKELTEADEILYPEEPGSHKLKS